MTAAWSCCPTYEANMRRIRVLFLALLTGIAAPAVAQSSDSSQPIRIQADSATLDDRKNVAIYTGNVIITQGSMRLTGARVTLTLDNAGEVQKLVSNGSPATFRQTPPVASRWMPAPRPSNTMPTPSGWC